MEKTLNIKEENENEMNPYLEEILTEKHKTKKKATKPKQKNDDDSEEMDKVDELKKTYSSRRRSGILINKEEIDSLIKNKIDTSIDMLLSKKRSSGGLSTKSNKSGKKQKK